MVVPIQTNQVASSMVAQSAPVGELFKATHYNPTDPRQTKANANGIGAFNKPVQFGDVATGNRKYKQGELIAIDELKDVQTPYGSGIFRVNDRKNIRYNNGTDNFDIAVPNEVPDADTLRKRIGNNTFHFVKLAKADTTQQPVNSINNNMQQKYPALGNSFSTSTATSSTAGSQPKLPKKRNVLMEKVKKVGDTLKKISPTNLTEQFQGNRKDQAAAKDSAAKAAALDNRLKGKKDKTLLNSLNYSKIQ